MIRVWDFYPTFLDLAGTDYPESRGERKLKALMGKSFRPLFRDREFETEEYFVPMLSRARGMLRDQWKLANFYDGPFELYNLENDPTERENLAGEEPGKYAEMLALVRQYARDHGFAGDPQWDREVGNITRGWASDFWKGILEETVPDIMSDEVPVDAGLSLEFVGNLDFSGTQGKEIRLMKYGSPEILWRADPDQTHAAQGNNTIAFEDFPLLEPGTHYYLTWDAGWTNYEDGDQLRSVRPCMESAFAFRFRTAND